VKKKKCLRLSLRPVVFWGSGDEALRILFFCIRFA
jgi:hypothetical protein